MKETDGSVVSEAQTTLEELCTTSVNQLEQGYEDLSLHYRCTSHPSSSLKFSQSQIAAYTVARMPATCAVGHSILRRLMESRISLVPQTLLDLGSGPGSMIWSSLDVFSSLKRITYWEAHSLFREMMASAWARLGLEKTIELQSISNPLQDDSPWSKMHIENREFDVVWASYVLGELSARDQKTLLERAFHCTKGVLILSEPGTPEGFRRILEARSLLLSLGAHIIAPCTHRQKCPLKESNGDWCHFPVLLKRRPMHRQIKDKEATLPWEIEKYAYLIVSPRFFDNTPSPRGRIIKHPLRRKGHKIMDICEAEGEKRVVISKKNGALYKKALEKNWGDIWELE